jgi:hypothetical protein
MEFQDITRNIGMDEPQSQPKAEHREGPIARAIEQKTAKLPSDMFLWASLASMGASLTLELCGKDKAANFVAHWAPTVLVLGLYKKLVKLHGSDPEAAASASR